MNKLIAKCMSVLAAFTMNVAHAIDNSNFKGTYAFMLTGPATFMNASAPNTIGTGVLNADGAGNVTGHGVFRSQGIYCNGLLGGTYQIGDDGIGTLHTIASTSTKVQGCFNTALNLQLAVAQNGMKIPVVSNQNDYFTGNFIKQDKAQFSAADFKGDYAFELQGKSGVVSQGGAYTIGVGRLSSDGQGKVIGRAVFRSADTLCNGTINGTSQIQEDGTGTITSKFVTSTTGCNSMSVNLSCAIVNDSQILLTNYENDMLSGVAYSQR